MCDGQATSKHINDISIVRPLMLHKTSKNNFELLAPTSQPVVELSPYPLPSPRLPITYPRNIARLQTEMSATRKANEEGGIKGFLTRAGKSFYAGGMFAKEKAWTAAQYGGRFCFVVATTSIVVLMPLIFEIMREGQVRLCRFCIITF